MTLLIDVRNPEEYAEGHVEGAIHIPLMALLYGDLDMLGTVDKNERIELYCLSGGRAERAKELLVAKGFTQVVNRGGLADVENSAPIRS